VLALLPDRRQNLLFSATFRRPCNLLLRCCYVSRSASMSPPLLRPRRTFNSAHRVDPNAARNGWRYLIQHHGWKRTLVFVASSTPLSTSRENYSAWALPQEHCMVNSARARGTQVSHQSRLGMIATDVACRGIDISELPLW